MFSLIDHQGVTECKHGLGVRTGFPTNCKLQDSFKLPLSASTALSELNLLLTGGRVTNHTKEAVMQHSKNQNDDVKAVQDWIRKSNSSVAVALIDNDGFTMVVLCFVIIFFVSGCKICPAAVFDTFFLNLSMA